MKALTTLIISSILLTTAPTSAAPAQPVPETQDTPETVENDTVDTLDAYGTYGADATQAADLATAMDAFASAGMPLPELRIYFHSSDDACRGNHGLYGKGGDKHRVDFCTSVASVIRHELAHAWEHHNMAESTRETFMEQADLANWNDHDAPHPSRAIEQVAYLISWGLDSQPLQRITANQNSEDLDRFELLTGSQSPRIAHWDDEAASPRRTRPVVEGSSTAVDFQ